MSATSTQTRKEKFLELFPYLKNHAIRKPWHNQTDDRTMCMYTCCYLPSRVKAVLLAECLRCVFPVIESLYRSDDRIAHQVGDALAAWARNPTEETLESLDEIHQTAARRISIGISLGVQAAIELKHEVLDWIVEEVEGSIGHLIGLGYRGYSRPSARGAQWRWMKQALRACKPIPWKKVWNSSTVVALADGIYSSRDFSVMPILADALQDAGCNNDKALARLRDPNAAFTRADVCLWKPLGLDKAAPLLPYMYTR